MLEISTAARRSVASAALLGAVAGGSLFVTALVLYWIWLFGLSAIGMSAGMGGNRAVLDTLPSGETISIVGGIVGVVATTLLGLGIWAVLRVFVARRRERDPVVTTVSLGSVTLASMLGVLAALKLLVVLPPLLNLVAMPIAIWSAAFVAAGVQHARWMVLIWAAAFAALNWVAYSTIRHLVRL